ncbi:MAG: UDP-N-acetylglucosamine 2-epimerase (non-hydrolyzing) [Verrucomicrobiota bacterium]|nr:UDP-N-acetylglucosamine 2-epimerase (non-hydrolyzing) [Verrucomicrobiota bacterium]
MSLNILTIVGARPQFVKAAALSKALRKHNTLNKDTINETVIHTGQHYDQNMSSVFFEELGIPKPSVNLHIGGGSHAENTGKMIIELEKVLLDFKFDLLVVYGDTDSTLATALTASKLHIPIAHIEAGLRSFNRKMPEEINRVLTDHLSSLLFCPTLKSIENLKAEGIERGVYHTGDIMYDAKIMVDELAEKSDILKKLSLNSKDYYLVTIHRPYNTDIKNNLENIFLTLNKLAERKKIVLPLHPRTKKMLKMFDLDNLAEKLKIIEPVSFVEMNKLMKNAATIITDSGGIQKEAYFHKRPCVTVRKETEWLETIEAGWNKLTAPVTKEIINAVKNSSVGKAIPEYGTGNSAEIIIKEILNFC